MGAGHLFTVRYTIENELRRIWDIFPLKSWVASWNKWGESIESPRSVFQIIRSLEAAKIITPDLSKLIREVYRACSPAIHGEEITETTVSFVRKLFPDIMAYLTSIQDLHKIIEESEPD